MSRFLFTSSCIAVAMAASAQIQLDYYAGLDGLSGAELKDAIHTLVTSDVAMLPYGNNGTSTNITKPKTWWGFYLTDRDSDGKVIDRYSGETFSFSNRGNSVSGMNIEHSFPKSWWGGNENNAYKDLINLMPCESTINNWKSNYPMGKVDNVWRTNGVTKIGTPAGSSDSQSTRFWEPDDKWKGDFARGYFYMATAYQDFTWSGDQALRILDNNTYPTLKEWAYTLYLEWARNDKVAEIETDRNNNVQWMQGNRNPYVDFPNLAEYVWGDSVGVAFHPLTSVKSQSFTGGGTIGAAEPQEVYSSSFTADNGNCAVYKISSARDPWVQSSQYGWKASAASGSGDNVRNYQTDASLVTPVLDLTGYVRANATFSHAAKFIEKPQEAFSVVVYDGNNRSERLHVQRWPLGVNWDFVPSGSVDLTPWCGKKVRLGFRYTSTTDEAGTWELKNLTVTGHAKTSVIDTAYPDCDPNISDLPEEYYTVDGRRIFSRDGYHGILIVRRGIQVSKILVP